MPITQTKAAHPMPFPATRQPSATVPAHSPSVRTPPPTGTGHRQKKEPHDTAPPAERRHARSYGVHRSKPPQSRRRNRRHAGMFPQSRPSVRYIPQKNTERIKTVSAALSHRRYCLSAAGRLRVPASLPPTCRPAGLRRNSRPLNPTRHPKGVSHPLSPPCPHSTVRGGRRVYRYRKYRTPIPERYRV